MTAINLTKASDLIGTTVEGLGKVEDAINAGKYSQYLINGEWVCQIVIDLYTA